MPDQDAPQVPLPQDSSQPRAKIKARVGAATEPRSLKDRLAEIASARVDPANDRLLLYEVLLEEYESLDQPRLDPADMEQIRSEIEAIRLEGESCQRECAGLPDEKRDAFEEI